MKTKLPWLLIYLRFALTPVAAWMGYSGYTGIPFVVLMVVAALSDVYDGKLARRFNAETGTLRQMDSVADTVFFIGVLAGLCFAYPQLVKDQLWGIVVVLAIEAIRYAIDLGKFKRGASYHAISAKVFGVSLLVAILVIMGTGYTAYFLSIAIFFGIVSGIEGLIMSCILPEWTYNVKHIGKALEIRRNKYRS